MTTPRLCVIVRGDLPPGARIAQAVHGAHEFSEAHPDDYRAWRNASNTVAILGARDEAHLVEVQDQAEMYGIPTATFREPALDDSTTVLVLGPHPATRKVTRGLPLLS
jgi:peptidyl-tRNA hydrolase